jgi:hypothetical protein
MLSLYAPEGLYNRHHGMPEGMYRCDKIQTMRDESK